MGEISLTGQDLLDMASARLAGYANFPSPDALMSFLNEAKDEVWAILKNLNADFFMNTTQPTDNTQVNYFGPMSTNNRLYTLPEDFREMHLIVVLDPAYAQTKFTYKKMTDRDFQEAYKSANVDSTITPTVEYFYTIYGKDQFLLAQFPEFPFAQPQLFYVRNILDFEINDPVDQIVLPFSKKIANYAAMRVMLSAQDQSQFEEWKSVWKDDIVMIASSAGPRNMADPEFVDDFLG